jgi:nitroreductase
MRATRSCRFFAPDPVDRALVERIIEAARWAGSARNAQPWRFAAVTGAGARGSLASLGAYAQHLAGAPLVLVLLEPSPGSRDTQFDLGRVAQNIALAASALGLGSCVATFYPGSNAESAAAVAGFGPDWTARHALALGWPASGSSMVTGRSAIPGGRLPVSELLRWHEGP